MAGCPICEDLHHGASRCPHSLVGETLGKYEVTGFLAAGAMGVVYVGQHQSLGSPVAIKTLHRALLPDHARTDERRKLAETLVQRFAEEARRAASLRHPNIVRVEDLGTAPDGVPYLAMELLEGQPLDELVEAAGPLSPERAAELAAQALDGLEFAHQSNIIHRDVKPENLFLQHPGTDRELVKVVDFGIAKAVGDGASQLGLTQTGHGAMGTSDYMSPEQAADPRNVTASSDVFSVGASLFELLTAESVLFEIERELTEAGCVAMQFLHGMLSAIIEGNIERHPRKLRPEIPDWLDAIVARSLAQNPDERFASAGEMAAALRAKEMVEPVAATPVALADTTPVEMTDPSPAATMASAAGERDETERKGSSRARLWAVGGVGSVVVVGAAIAVFAAGNSSHSAALMPTEPAELQSVDDRCGRGLRHEPVKRAPARKPVRIVAELGSDLAADKVSLSYRRPGASKWRDVALEASGCEYAGTIPRSALRGDALHYYIAAIDRDDKLAASAGSPDAPNIIEITGGDPPPRAAKQRSGAAKREPAGLPLAPSNQDVERGIDRVRDRIASCGKQTSFNGAVKTRWKIRPDGRVTGVTTTGAAPKSIASCIKAAVRSARFARSQNGMLVTYRFGFAN